MEKLFVICMRIYQIIILISMYAIAIGMIISPQKTLWLLIQLAMKIGWRSRFSGEGVEARWERIQKWPPTTFHRLRWWGIVLFIATTIVIVVGIRRGAIIP